MTAAAHLSLYDGRERMGSFVDNGECCKARDAKGKLLGTFKNQKKAIAAIDAKYRGIAKSRGQRHG